ncbi:hypothetical protein OHS33_02255 [Streptomyces sp. NBC_00536]|uniref:hypothetical protein n=1 Tax=Streptomyces sp. NBC_00536 TaxID=2975769 RepID=UPI002E814D99|nr:hypothetical protein [Streptomyces sp. NBC_00536]WUC77275.1 hypothetical protein OHS33_02255 [Streptomyces sp. NBC_00536]
MTTSTTRSPLGDTLGLVGFVLIVGGASGLLHEWYGWIRFLGFLRHLIPAGYEVLGYVVMIALGTAASAGASLAGRRRTG